MQRAVLERPPAAPVVDEIARRRAANLLGLALAAALAVIALYVVFVRTRWGQTVDDLALRGRNVASAAQTRHTDNLLRTMTRSTLGLLGLGLCLVAWARWRPRLAIGVGVALAGALLTTEALKLRILTRPVFPGVVSEWPENSFPSGHTTIGMGLALGLVVVVGRRWRWLAALVAALVSTLIGTAVVASGWHRPSDVVAAYLVVLGWYAAVAAVLLRWRGRGDPALPVVEQSPRPTTAQVTAASGLLVLVTAVGALALSLRAKGLETIQPGTHFVLACLLIDAAGVAVIALVHLLLRDVSLDPPAPAPAPATIG